MADIDNLVEQISNLTLLEAAQLKDALEETLGVTAAAPMAMPAMMPGMMGDGGSAAAEVVEEKEDWNVVLKDFGAKKIDVIKAVRKLTDLGLKDAKEMVEGVPSTVLELVPKDTAEAAKADLEAAGAVVELT